MNVRYRVTLTRYERDELGGLVSGGKNRARKLKRDPIGRGRGGQRWGYRPERGGWRVDGLPDQATPRRRRPGTGAADSAREPVARNGAPAFGGEPSQAVAQGYVVHSPGRR